MSHGALRLLTEEVGCRAHFVPWDLAGIDDDADIQDYRSGTRVTALLTPTPTSRGRGEKAGFEASRLGG